MNKMVLAGLLALGFCGVANAAEVRMLTPEQTQTLEQQAQQTDMQLGEFAEPTANDDMSIEARRVSCYARDAFRTTYRVTGFGNPNWIQREAVRYCQRMSRVPYSCRALGCGY